MKAFNFEIYTINPETSETGWDIKFRTVFAETKTEAKEQLKLTPDFDCVILFNYSKDVDMSNLTTAQLNAINCGFIDYSEYNHFDAF